MSDFTDQSNLYVYQNRLVKILLAPFAALYGLGVSLRDFFYRRGLLKGIEFDLPIIAVGNLTVGGAGKSPHIEYLIRLLKDHLDLATLSRGYKRKTKGFLQVQRNSTVEEVGDEPFQFKTKFPDIRVAVCESRTFAIPELKKLDPELDLVLLDDAFQHRSIRPGLNILLTEFSLPFTRDHLLPSGRLREWRSAYQRADIIIVSKCPVDVRPQERLDLVAEIQPLPHQKVFFSFYQYGKPYFLFDRRYTTTLQADWEVVLICAIASTDYLVGYLEEQVARVHSLEYEDHHYFTNLDIGQLKNFYDKLESDKKLVVTTEKDATRLLAHRAFLLEHKIPVFVLPVEVDFLFGEAEVFDQTIRDFLLDFRQ